MATYPTLSRRPSRPLSVKPDDNIIKSPKSAGYVHKRPRYTRIPKTFTLEYPAMPPWDLDVLTAHYGANMATAFFFYNFDEAYHPDRAWQPNTVYAVGTIVRPTAFNGRSYICTVGGTSGSVGISGDLTLESGSPILLESGAPILLETTASGEPAWSTTEGSTILDGSTLQWMENSYVCTYGQPIESASDNYHTYKVKVMLEQV